MSFEIKGLDSLMKKLDAVPGAITQSCIDGENKTLADITATAKELCPVDTGQLRDSIEPYMDAHKAKADSGTVSGATGTNVEHGIFQEFGTGPVGENTPVAGKSPDDVAHRKTGWTYYSEKLGRFVRTNGQPAQPFLYPASQQRAPELPGNIQKAAQERLKGLEK